MGYWVLFWILCAIAGAAMLSRYNKAGSGFLLGGLLGPIGLIIAWTMRDSAKIDEVTAARPPTPPSYSPGWDDLRATTQQSSPVEVRDERECPFCAERILRKARVCKHCNREVQPLV